MTNLHCARSDIQLTRREHGVELIREVPENGFEVEFVHFVLLQDPQQVQSIGGTEYQTSLQPEIFSSSHKSEPRLGVDPAPRANSMMWSHNINVEPQHQLTEVRLFPHDRANSQRTEKTTQHTCDPVCNANNSAGSREVEDAADDCGFAHPPLLPLPLPNSNPKKRGKKEKTETKEEGYPLPKPKPPEPHAVNRVVGKPSREWLGQSVAQRMCWVCRPDIR